jgi:hypothetical protein
MRPGDDRVDGGLLIFQRSSEQAVGHFHRERGAQQGQAGRALRRPGRRFQHDQRTHAVTGQQRTLDARRIEQGDQPVGQRLDRAQGRPGAAPVARQVGRQHGKPARGQRPALLRPHRVVVQGAVHQHDRGQRRIERVVAGMAKGGIPVDRELHVR